MKVLYQWTANINILENKYTFNNVLYFLLILRKFGESYMYSQNQLIFFTYLILIFILFITRKWPKSLSGREKAKQVQTA